VAISTNHCSGRFPVRLKFLRESRSEKSGGRFFSCCQGVDDGLRADDSAHVPPGSDVGNGKGVGGLTFHEFLAKKAVVLLDPFRIPSHRLLPKRNVFQRQLLRYVSES
jgi:hypothetical protein